MATPIWQDYIISVGTGGSVPYEVKDSTGGVIYTGTAYGIGGAAKVNLSDIVRHRLHQTWEGDQVQTNVFLPAPIREKFALWAGGSKVDDQSMFLDYSYDYGLVTSAWARNEPIQTDVQLGVPIPYTSMDSSLSLAYSVNGTAQTPIAFTGYGNAFVLAGSQVGDVITIAGKAFTVRHPAACRRFALYYVNALGGWDCLLCAEKSAQTDSYDRERHTRSIDNSALSARDNVEHQNNITRTLELHTDYLTDEQAARMHHLLGSTMVYLYDTLTQTATPVNITNSLCEYKEYQRGRLNEYTISVEVARTMIRRA